MWTQLKEWIYPDKCIVCGKLLPTINNNRNYFCIACESGLLEHYICERCGKPYALGTQCIFCEYQPTQITRVQSLFPYRARYRESIKRWKYGGYRKYARGYGEMIASHHILSKKSQIDLLIPVPLSDKRYMTRGFNQALDLAEVISAYTDIPVWDGLKRINHTKPQSACTKEERIKNIRGTIICEPYLKKETALNIALIDDIYTTGSTVNECIKTLKNSGFELQEVNVLTVCVGI